MDKGWERYVDKEGLKKYCPGCSHPLVAMAVAQALAQLDISPEDVVLVTDIGCCGLADHYFLTHTVHTLHGRSTAVATGIAFASEYLQKKKSKVIVFIGDGGASIGLLHLLEACRISSPICVILHNNFLYGMTGGQSSSSTPLGWISRSAPEGNVFPPLSFYQLARECTPTYLARVLPTHRRLPEIIQKALACEGFSLIEVLELCTAYAVKWNRLTMKKLEEELQKMGWEEKEEHFTRFRPAMPKGEKVHLEIVNPEKKTQISSIFRVIIAGGAGQGVQWASRKIATNAGNQGLWVSLKNEIPITVSTGYSIAEIIFSPHPIAYTGIENPDAVLITALPGWQRVRHRLLSASPCLVFVDSSVPEQEVNLLREKGHTVIGRNYSQNRDQSPVFLAFQDFLSFHPLFSFSVG
ncbi:MAG: thiamine pyrophosphate-dependent enzyme [bacterium JZ-2024 1]